MRESQIPQVRSKPKKKRKKKIKIDISCPGVFELLAVIQKKIVVNVQRVSVCVCRGVFAGPRAHSIQQMDKKLSLCILIGHLRLLFGRPLG